MEKIYHRIEHILSIKANMDSLAHLQVIANALSKTVQNLKDEGEIDRLRRAKEIRLSHSLKVA